MKFIKPDTTKPILEQIEAMSVAQYNDWIATGPELPHTRYRLFHTDALEYVTRCVWFAPALVYSALCAMAWVSAGEAVGAAAVVWMAVGWITWWGLEYTIHRYLFHAPVIFGWQKQAWFLMHHLHHKTPSDADRLVFHPAVSFPVVTVVAGALWCVLPFRVWLPLISGGVINYACVYECTHYLCHHGKDYGVYPWFRMLSEKHMKHHYSTPERKFSISPNPLDTLCGTL